MPSDIVQYSSVPFNLNIKKGRETTFNDIRVRRAQAQKTWSVDFLVSSNWLKRRMFCHKFCDLIPREKVTQSVMISIGCDVIPMKQNRYTRLRIFVMSYSMKSRLKDIRLKKNYSKSQIGMEFPIQALV